MTTDAYRFEVTDPARLDCFLAQQLQLSRAQAQRLIEQSPVQVNQQHAVKGLMLQPLDVVEVPPFDRPQDQRAIAQDDPRVIELAHQNGWVMVNKPAGMPIHPLKPGETGTLLNTLIARYPQIHSIGEGGLRSGVVHRLDMGTTGVVAFALDSATWHTFRQAFTDHTTRKTYRALVHGQPQSQGREQCPLRITRHKPAHVVVGHGHDERLCRLAWRVRHVLTDAAEIEVDLETGFLHQVRVMLAHLGHPLLGDTQYGAVDHWPRPMLHAARLEIGDAQATCDPPDDYLATRQTLIPPLSP